MLGLGLSVTQLAARGLRLTDLAAAIRSLFAAGEQGVWYDPSDITRYADQFGPELITNGAFGSGTTGWAASNLAALSVSSGVLRVTGTGNNWQLATQTFSGLVIGKMYRVSVDLKGTSGVTNSYVAIDNAVEKTSQGATAKTIAFDFTATATSHAISLGLSQVVASGDWVEFDNVSIREYSVLVTSGTLYQDAAGTIPVTAVEQPVGLMLDKSKGLVLGAQYLGAYLTAAYWNIYAIDVTFPGTTINFSAASARLAATSTLVAGKTYFCSVTFTSTGGCFFTLDDDGVGGGPGVATSYTPGSGLSASGSFYFRATSSSRLRILQAGSGTLTVSSLSIRELTGNHAYQTTSVNRPVLSARYNLLTKTEQFDDADWVKVNANAVQNSTASPTGTTTGDTVRLNAGASLTVGALGLFTNPDNYVSQSSAAALSATAHTYSVYVKGGAGLSHAQLRVSTYVSLNPPTASVLVRLSDGAIISGSATVTDAGNGWWRVSLPFTAVAAVHHCGIWLWNSSSISSAAGTEGIYIWGADLRVANDGVNLPPYQRVNTATDYDTVGFPPYLSFNGSNQWLQTNSIDFTATDKMTVFAGARKLVAQDAVLIEQSSDFSANAGSFIVSSGTSLGHYFGLRGSGLEAYNSTFAAPQTSVQSVAFDIGGSTLADEIKPRINGAIPSLTVATAGPAGTGNYGNYPLYIGARAGTSLWFNGRLYQLIARGAQSTDQQIIDAERYINEKTRAY